MKKDKALNNIYRRLQRDKLLGCTWVSKRGKSVIAIAVTDPKHNDFKEYLDTCVHEWLHSRFPDLTESQTDDLSKKYLESVGLNNPTMPSLFEGIQT